jgi:hypothetical protein
MPKANIADDDHPPLHEDVATFSGGPNRSEKVGELAGCSLILGQLGATRPSPTSR